MNAEQLIERVIGLVDDPDWEDSEVILGYLNGSQKRIADTLFLPDLQNGFDTVDTEIGVFEVAMPATFHKDLFLAMVDGEDVDVHLDLASMAQILGGLSTDAGDITGVCDRGSGELLYQAVPAVITTISLFYYRLPILMTESANSYPDGAKGNDDYHWALIHDSTSQIFNEIEDGLEGAKVNTTKHDEKFSERMGMLDAYSQGKGPAFKSRPSTNLRWLGVK